MKKLVVLILIMVCSSAVYSGAQNVSNVTVSGLFFVDKTLAGNFSADSSILVQPLSYSFEWMSAPSTGGSATVIPGSPNSLSYKIASSVLGRRIQLRITITDNVGTEVSDSSSLSPVVGANTLPYVIPGTISISQYPANLNVGTTLVGDYTYDDNEDDPEGASQYRWLRSDLPMGSYDYVVSTNKAYNIQLADQGKWFRFEVTPVAANGSSPGNPALSPELGPVNSAPSVSGVSIFGSLQADSTVKARYSYFDADGDIDESTFQWYLNGTEIGGANDSAYTIQGSDEGSILMVMVTPRSATGYPNTGTPQSASVSLGYSSLPLALNVCISGRRIVNETLKGNWEYQYENSTGEEISAQRNSIAEWLFDGVVVKTSDDSDNINSSPSLQAADLNKRIEFRITPRSRTGAQGVPVTSQEMAIFNMSRTEFTQDGGDEELIASPSGGEFSCFAASEAVSGNYFRPSQVPVGDYSIRYSVDITLGDNTYNQKTWKTLSVTEALSFFDSFDDHYCKGPGRIDTIYVRNTTYEGPKFSWAFTLSNPRAYAADLNDTTIVVYIDSLLSGSGKDYLSYSYTTAITKHNVPPQYFVIDSVGQQLAISDIEEAYCQEQAADSVSAVNLYPAGGSGIWSGDVIRDGFERSAWLDPSLATATGRNYIYYTYNSPLGCSFTVRDSVYINPTPKAGFRVDDRCIDFAGDTTWFENTTTCTDSISSWLWSFDETSGSSTRKDPGFIYKSGGTRIVRLTAESVNGCINTLDTTILIARKPLSDFRWEDDCYHEGQDLLLFDESYFTESVDSAIWIINDADIWRKQGTGYDTLYNKNKGPEIIKVDYLLETPVDGCLDISSRYIYIRPVEIISEKDYFENFDTAKLGWFADTSTAGSWAKGIPLRFGAEAASADSAWYTDYDMLNQVKSGYSVESPCFDFTDVERPMIVMDIMRRFDRGRDGAVIQYRIGNNATWENIGGTFYGINWYQNSNIFGRPGESVVGWSPEEEDENWVEARQYLDDLIGLQDVKLRIAYGSAGPSEGNLENEGFAFDNIRISERERKVLIEHFTNSQEANSPAADAIVNNILEESPKDALNIQYHTGYVPGDPFYIENTADPSARILYYGLSSVPYALYDGGFNTPGSWARKYTFDTGYEADINHLRNRSLIDPLFEISVDTAESKTWYKVRMEALEHINVEDITLFIAIVAEKATSDGIDNGQTVFRNVLRKMHPDAGGSSMLTEWMPGDSYTTEAFNLVNIVPGSYDIDSVRVIAFLQNSYTKEIYQAAVSDPLNVNLTSTGKVRYEEAEFSIFPNPANSNLTLLLDKEVRGDSRYTIYTGTGIAVRQGRMQPGSRRINIENLGLADGIYIVRVQIDGRPAGYRKLIVARR
ncbi:MAG: T9SS type A sorting domain-containing protein [Marinilabiliaceae bacterium]|nr:T9SS type A sorting domain-containing protein [Marinilabiliaceae bacterium]